MEALIADANVLLRLVTRAPETMFRAARDFLLDLEAQGRRLKVHPMHVAEAIYVLEGEVYGLSPEEAARELGTLLTARVFEPLDEAALMRALEAYPGTGLDFPGVFLLAWAEEYGGQVLSFDRGLRKAGTSAIDPAAGER
ncbi:PIN domain-containing protein [Oceanithermus sp.]